MLPPEPVSAGHPIPSFWGDWQRRRVHQATGEHDHNHGIQWREWNARTKNAWEREAKTFYATKYASFRAHILGARRGYSEGGRRSKAADDRSEGGRRSKAADD